ncbi:AsmA family protein [Subsaxibacter sp. CAU 1640]|uniref:AsmA-like C-terminal region-containing protein n=1 Tax=Subsaxibacter sp. CAU 1640 TaxID=2933271 RepID=UPI0020051CB2|nr:AsmA-like C-terminal region-containing protein [Subsaxibacter sp. CAU 1640]MCK7590384.1 AsmA family protein [Subsaxibacter sp. CAU 1640]
MDTTKKRTSPLKKILKITGITLLILIVLLIAAPFIFQSQIKDMVKNFINQNVNAQVEFSDVSLSLFRSFPKAHVEVSDLVITNFEPFKDETLATAKNLSFSMSVKELFKSADEGAIVVNTITLDEALLTLKTNSFGETNYDIVKERPNSADSSSFAFDIKDYSINNSALTYIDEGSKLTMYITELNHSGSAKFTDQISELDTKSEANISLTMDSTKYLNNNHIKLDALLDMDLNNQKYTFKENKGYINQLPLEFKGFIQVIDEGQDIDITFENPGSSFKDFLAVIPETYSKNIENVETTGDFKVSGVIKGKVTETTIPTLDISIKSDNASFKYPDLPKKVENIVIDTEIKNDTGNADDTYVAISTLNFRIDNDVFKSSALIRNLTGNTLVDADINGVLNLANLTKAYPIELESALSGILRAKLNMAFDMNAIETNAYDRIRASGNASITDMVFSSDAMNNPMQISKADMTFNPSTVTLNTFNAKTGQSDISATGTINNLIGFMLSKKVDLKGNFNVNSNTFALSDFMSEETTTTESTNTASNSSATTEGLKIPEFLDCTITANANTVIYDNLNLKEVKGTLSIKDQQATLSGLTSKLFDGLLTVSGNVSTKTDTPSFNLKLDASSFDIAKSFNNLELLQSLAPIAKVLQGKLNTNINISGLLDKEFTPQLNTVSGNAFAKIDAREINEENTPLLSKLDGALNFIDFSKLDLTNLAANLEFANGRVNVKPINLAYKDIGITIAGAHGFDKSLAYDATFNVPAKYLGGEVNRLIGKINDNEVNKISIPVTANISGTFTNPQVKTDLTSGISNLTQQLIEIEKQKLIGQGKDKIKDLLSGIAGGNNTTGNTTSKDTTKVATDTTKTKPKDQVKEGVKNVLGNILGGKNKKKDSVN